MSVVIAGYNVAKTIAQTLDSILAQAGRFEVVIVDDGSTDATPAVLEPYKDRVRVLRQPNGGLPAARNAGCAAARGEFIAIMDADDLCRPERVLLQHAVLTRHPEVVLCSSDFAAFGESGPISPSYGSTYYSAIGDASRLDSLYPEHETFEFGRGAWPGLEAPASIAVRRGNVYRELAFGNFVHPPTVMFRKDVLERAGPADDALRYTSDWDWFVRMARLGPFAHIARPLLDYRISASQMSSVRVSNGQVAVDVIGAADKIWAADPSLAAEQPARVRRCIRDFCFDAAYAMAERRKGVAARIAMPTAITQVLRRKAAAAA